ncbi:MAG TPA: PEP-CTERM sorting domain-containing protein [Acetobacteraceae bacterium]|jgi:hypothetical protein|nr:PEP-CTERM sorting domain-containing protein [Acetobacteraceae bacterium]
MRNIAVVAALALVTAATSANAASTSPGFSYNYGFPDGSPGFALNGFLPAAQNTGLLLPAVLVGFNPQPDPPGTPPTLLSLIDPTDPALSNLSSGPGYSLVMSFLNLIPPGPCDTAIPAPNWNGITGFSCSGIVEGQRGTLDVSMEFSGPGGVASWVAFNPQPDPPGLPIGFDLSFGGLATAGGFATPADPIFTFAITLNGAPLEFRLVPEPGTLGLLGVAAIGIGLTRGRRSHAGVRGS